jgi:purine-nucleoside phosphorylase
MPEPPLALAWQQTGSAADYVRERTRLEPKLGIVLGSGLGGFAERLADATAIPYSEIPHFPCPTVEGHTGRLVIGSFAGLPVAVMQGRVHAYEGYSPGQVIFPTRVLARLGVSTLIVTNAAGGIRPDLAAGQLVLISDHINFTGSHPLAGPNDERLGQRFFDMSDAYSRRLRALAHRAAATEGIALSEGVYLGLSGPSFETPAEIRAYRILGADLVGMSTVHEVIAARHLGMEVLGFSSVTNMAAGILDQPINHAEVLEIGGIVQHSLSRLLAVLIPLLP